MVEKQVGEGGMAHTAAKRDTREKGTKKRGKEKNHKEAK